VLLSRCISAGRTTPSLQRGAAALAALSILPGWHSKRVNSHVCQAPAIHVMTQTQLLMPAACRVWPTRHMKTPCGSTVPTGLSSTKSMQGKEEQPKHMMHDAHMERC
jgi:hypothetical protein